MPRSDRQGCLRRRRRGCGRESGAGERDAGAGERGSGAGAGARILPRDVRVPSRGGWRHRVGELRDGRPGALQAGARGRQQPGLLWHARQRGRLAAEAEGAGLGRRRRRAGGDGQGIERGAAPRRAGRGGGDGGVWARAAGHRGCDGAVGAARGPVAPAVLRRGGARGGGSALRW